MLPVWKTQTGYPLPTRNWPPASVSIITALDILGQPRQPSRVCGCTLPGCRPDRVSNATNYDWGMPRVASLSTSAAIPMRSSCAPRSL